MIKRINLLVLVILTSVSCFSQQDIDVNFKKTDWTALEENAVKLIGKDWMLVSAGSIDSSFNMMTASWGGFGWVFGKPTAYIFINPLRYTYQFVENEEYFVLTFYSDDYKDVLKKMGTVSGRDYDKINESGISPISTENGSVAFAEARIIVECKKFYATKIIKEDFINEEDAPKYPNKEDYQTMYFGEIINVWIKE